MSRFVDLRDVSKVYPGSGGQDDIRALSGVSARIDDGERVGVIGVNGAGKSTMLQLIAGVTPATSGEVEVEGKVHAILTIGMGLREEETGRANLFLDGAMLGRSHDEVAAKLDEMIAFAELGEFIDRPVRTYSSGMKARLGFASLITIDPEILIIDEALAVGDAFFAAKAYDAIIRLASRGAIVILVSHSLFTINQFCQRCIWIDGGEVRMDGPSEIVTAAYRESIHAREEAEISRKFGDAGAPWSNDAGYTIDRVELRGARDRIARTLIEAGEPAVLAVKISGANASRPTRLRIWVERNDGLVLFDEQIDAPASNEDSGREIEIELGRLNWRPFLYQFHAEIVGQRGSLAHNAVTAKIWSDHVIFGGAPLLREPIGIGARRG